MKVHIKRNFNGPDDILYLQRLSPVEMEESVLPYLPSDARIEGDTRDQTRRKVLLERRRLKLDQPPPLRGGAERAGIQTSDEDLLKEEPKAPAKAPDTPVTKAALDANLKTAQANLENAEKKLADAADEPAKGVAKADLALAQKGVEEAKGALLSFDDAKKK